MYASVFLVILVTYYIYNKHSGNTRSLKQNKKISHEITEEIKSKSYNDLEEENVFTKYSYISLDLYYCLMESFARNTRLSMMKEVEGKGYSELINQRDYFSSGTLREKNRSIYSIGPDRKDDLITIIYDPTNGTFSRGDIIIMRGITVFETE